MAIPQHTIDQILDRIDLIDLVGKYVKLKKSGSSYVGCCPFHQEKTPSFHVYREKQYFHCFGCQEHGNAISFLMKIESRGFIDVMQEFSSQTGIELPQSEKPKNISYRRQAAARAAPTHHDAIAPEPLHNMAHHDPFAELNQHFDSTANEQNLDGNLYDLLEAVTRFYEQQLQHSPLAQQYFKQRGLSDETIRAWRLGYAPEPWQHLEYAFPQDIQGLKQLGLVRSSENNRDFNLLRHRVIFPIRDSRGRVVGFGGRALNDDVKPKYINSPDSEIFHKNQLLYGLYEGSKAKADRWLMVEGYMDVIALHQNGIHGAVATLGTASNTEHLQQLFKRNPHLTLAFDGDAAGQKAARRTLEIALPILQDGRELQFFVLPNEHDPDSLIRQKGKEYFQQLWRTSPFLSDFLFSMLTQNLDITTPENKSAILANLRKLTDLLPKNGSFRYILTQSFKEKLGLGWRFSSKKSQDANLSFQVPDVEDTVIALLLLHPHLYVEFIDLLTLMPKDRLLSQICHLIQRVQDQLPNNEYAQSYYILGATRAYQHDLQRILQQHTSNHMTIQQSAEQQAQAMKMLSLKLKSRYIDYKLKSTQGLKLDEIQRLRQELNKINHLLISPTPI